MGITSFWRSEALCFAGAEGGAAAVAEEVVGAGLGWPREELTDSRRLSSTAGMNQSFVCGMLWLDSTVKGALARTQMVFMRRVRNHSAALFECVVELLLSG
jgi:hypothetical protein